MKKLHPNSQGRFAAVTGALLLVLASSTSAAQDFGPEELLDLSAVGSTFSNPTRIHWADLDGDGDLDPAFVQATLPRGSTAWAENLGDGTFGTTRLLGGTSPNLITNGAPFGADLDQDGDVDLLVTYLTDSPASHIGWLENLGGGSFAAQVMLTPIDDVDLRGDVAVLDLDGDGDQDIVTESYGGQWYENLGGLVFAPASPLLPAGAAQSGAAEIATGDIDGDGLDEVFMSVSRHGIYQVGSDGLGGVAPATLIVSVPVTEWSTAVAFGDVDGDGDGDLLSEARPRDTSNIRTVTLFENDGSGALASRTWSVNEEVHNGLQLADIDGDGLLDLVRADLVSDSVLVSLQTAGSPTLGAPASAAGPIFSRQAGAVDVNLDGHADLWLGLYGVEVALGLGNGNFSPPQPIGVASERAGPAAIGDMDGDGVTDVVLSSGQELQVLGGLPSGAYEMRGATDLFQGSVHAPALADVDGDGDLDVALSSGQFPDLGASLLVIENLGGSLGPPTTIETQFSDGAQRPSFGDADGDGDMDLFWSFEGFVQAPLSGGWAINDGAGVFAPSSLVAFEPGFRLLGLVDVDADGADDVLYLRQTSSGALVWRRTLPGGQLAPAAAILPLDGLAWQSNTPVALDDMNGDGQTDVIAMSPNWNEVRVYAGLIGGGFAAAVPAISLPVAASHVATLDADGDGLRDVVILGQAGGQIARGLGGLTFGAPVAISPSALDLERVTAADVDADGDDDLVIRSSSGVVFRRSLTHLGVGFCAPVPNSTGASAQVFGKGSRSVAANALRLEVQGLPPSQFGIFIMSDTTGWLPGLGGTPGLLCLDPARIVRLIGPGQILVSSAAGAVGLDLDLGQLPMAPPVGALAPGDTRYFQYWTRDGAAGTANLSGGLGVAFTR